VRIIVAAPDEVGHAPLMPRVERQRKSSIPWGADRVGLLRIVGENATRWQPSKHECKIAEQARDDGGPSYRSGKDYVVLGHHCEAPDQRIARRAAGSHVTAATGRRDS
jgi:hypothetical protein